MKLSQLVGRRTKEVPREATSVSHQYLLRGGYARQLASGIYSILPLGKRVLAKIEAIIRQEMDSIGGQEVLMPIVMPRELWEESGRYQTIDNSMVRFKDRNQKDFVLGMTHEEAVLALARAEVSSYKQLPVMLYQIQTKFRDEPRPRGGLIRVREFTMKDAYSFHRSREDLVRYYESCYKAYERIFARVGLKNTRVVESDTGMMGGAVAHEFMLEAAIGEDSLVLCDGCGYSANAEVAVCKHNQSAHMARALEKVATPSCKTIKELCTFLNVTPRQTAKAVFYSISDVDGAMTLVFCLTRGDKAVNDIKLSKILGMTSYEMASEEQIRSFGIEPGYASPVGLANHDGLLVIIDSSIAGEGDLITGANMTEVHFLHFNVRRDVSCSYKVADISSVVENDICAHCDGSLRLTRGIEIGNIFQLGNKYTSSMGMSYLDESGRSQTPVMGCYGIGVGRLMASIIEDSHDGRGPVWPWLVAPYQAHMCILDGNDKATTDRAKILYDELRNNGIEVLWDDTNAQAGVQFADADLIGAPLRLVISARNEKRGVIEFVLRDGSLKGEVKPTEVLSLIASQRR
jgi:prolyl-tRNA synthetase